MCSLTVRMKTHSVHKVLEVAEEDVVVLEVAEEDVVVLVVVEEVAVEVHHKLPEEGNKHLLQIVKLL